MLVFVALAAIAVAVVTRTPNFVGAVSAALANAPSALYRVLVDEFVLNPWLYLVFGLVLLLETRFPAKPAQPRFGLGLRFDVCCWYFVFALQKAIMLPVLAATLRLTFDTHLSFLRIEAAESWPWLVRVTLALFWGDFIFWFSHVVRHKVKVMWSFHAVHHSQRDLNFFSEFRLHPVDAIFVYVINFIPILMVEKGFATILAVVVLREWHTYFYHSNVRANMGWLRYILVTPQSHRIHHSNQPQHQDKNFGLTFSIWDHLFGTQYRNYDEYPDTGILESFPLEQSRGPIRALPAQLIHPFRTSVRGSWSRTH